MSTTVYHVFFSALFALVVSFGRAGLPRPSAPLPRAICPSTIFTFADSLFDIGNLCVDGERQGQFCVAKHLPYGMSLRNGPSGRWSDGLVVTDFLIDYLRIPEFDICSNSYHGNYFRGINYGYAGATVTNNNAAFGPLAVPNHILPRQIDDFLRYKKGVERSQSGTRHFFSNALYVLEIGGDDLNYAMQNTSMGVTGTLNLVPQVVSGLRDGILNLYQNGARHFLLFNMPAAGCLPLFLRNMLPANNGTAARLPLDRNGCITPVNNLIQLFNLQTNRMMEGLRLNKTMQDANFMYFDFYGAHMHAMQAGASMGFDPSTYSRSCCGRGGNQWNCVGGPLLCGCSPGASVCPNPNEYISWDGVHFTSHFYQRMATHIFRGEYLFPKIPLLAGCAPRM